MRANPRAAITFYHQLRKGEFPMEKQLLAPNRVLRDYLSDSRVWEDFLAQGGFVEGDIVVADPFKAGTTWTQRIVQQILHNGEEPEGGLSDTSPWLDSSWGDHAGMLQVLKEQRGAGLRRVIKSHLPADALPIAAEARYVFVGRNGKDLGSSFHNYLYNFNPATMKTINKIHAEWSGDPTPLVIPEDMREFFDLWLDNDGYQCCDLLDIMKSWWQLRDEPNVLLLHYGDLKRDLLGQIARLAEFFSIDPASLRMGVIAEHCSFDYMSERAEKMAPFGGTHMSDAKAFFHKGLTRDHRTELTAQQVERFDRTALEKLGPECAHWLETGEARSAS
ncbi:glycolipid sulfotransferase [Mycobacterium colombiense]|uniref:sulfotransferase domain-containing protein n=1 Tax=Mycobacterium colombiense TaxID=339268 RepID=UPI0007EF0157|nr:sulfotransferase domain-containing protein [Mycobacterium colombiense]OBK66683.1 glycolipid sulfotransferase [Mycobacterium colombiense]